MSIKFCGTHLLFIESSSLNIAFREISLSPLLQVLGTSLATLLLNVAGRRPLLMISTGLCSLFMGMLGTIFFLKEHEPQSGKHHIQ